MTKSLKRMLAYVILGFLPTIFLLGITVGFIMSIGWVGTFVVFIGVAGILLMIGAADWARRVIDESGDSDE